MRLANSLWAENDKPLVVIRGIGSIKIGCEKGIAPTILETKAIAVTLEKLTTDKHLCERYTSAGIQRALGCNKYLMLKAVFTTIIFNASVTFQAFD